jgi:lipid-A-disaccharide synthase
MDIILVANSPGELSALVKPVAQAINDHRVILVLTPCQYISGKELDYVKTIKNISAVITAEEYKNWLLINQRPKFKIASQGLVLYLGGDLAHAILVAKKVKFPAYAYVQERIGWTSSYKKFFVPDEDIARKFSRHHQKIKIVGNLMVDSVRELKKWHPEPNVFTFMPGSRDWQIKHMTPIYQRIMAAIKSQLPAATFQLVNSPFEKASHITGAKIIEFEQVINSELVITIPGTNTARLAALGLPMIVIFPLDNPDVIPLEGIPHYIGLVPYFGSKFKRFLADTLNKRNKFWALPNIKAKREIVPEIRGLIDPGIIAQKALALQKDRAKRNRMSSDLLNCLGGPGAATRIVEELNAALA